MDEEATSTQEALRREAYERSHDSFKRSFETSVKYSEMYLKNCILLNSGSILAFPTLAQVADISVNDHKVGFIVSMASLTLGLIASLVSVAAAAGWFERKMAVSQIDYFRQMKELEDKDYDMNDPKEFWRKRRFNGIYDRHNFYGSMTIRSGKLAGAAFIVGIVSAGLVVSEIDLLILGWFG